MLLLFQWPERGDAPDEIWQSQSMQQVNQRENEFAKLSPWRDGFPRNQAAYDKIEAQDSDAHAGARVDKE